MGQRHSAVLEIVREMREPDLAKEYYSARLFLNDANLPEWSIFSGWVEQKSWQPHIEIREASKVVPEIQIRRWRTMDEKYYVLSKDEHLLIFYLLGGNALIEASFAQKSLPPPGLRETC